MKNNNNNNIKLTMYTLIEIRIFFSLYNIVLTSFKYENTYEAASSIYNYSNKEYSYKKLYLIYNYRITFKINTRNNY